VKSEYNNKNHSILIIVRHEVVGLFGLEESGSSWLDRHGLLVVALLMLGGILYFPGREVKDKGDKEMMEEKIDEEGAKEEKVEEGTKEEKLDEGTKDRW
jgi:hypothetical protein